MICGNQDFLMDIGADWQRTIYLQDSNGVAIDITGSHVTVEIRSSDTGAALDSINDTDSPAGVTITGALGKIDLHFTAAQTSALDTTGIKKRTIIEYTDTNGVDIKGDGYAAYYALVITYADGLIERVIDGYMCLIQGGLEIV